MFTTSDGDERDDRRSPGTAIARTGATAGTDHETPHPLAAEVVSDGEPAPREAHDSSTEERSEAAGAAEPGEPTPVVRPRDRWSIIAIGGVALGGIVCMMVAVLVALFM